MVTILYTKDPNTMDEEEFSEFLAHPTRFMPRDSKYGLSYESMGVPNDTVIVDFEDIEKLLD